MLPVCQDRFLQTEQGAYIFTSELLICYFINNLKTLKKKRKLKLVISNMHFPCVHVHTVIRPYETNEAKTHNFSQVLLLNAAVKPPEQR